MKQTLKIIAITLCVAGLLAYIGFAAMHYPKKNEEKLCTGMIVSVMDSAEIHFIAKADIDSFINREKLNPVGKRMDSIDLTGIEKSIVASIRFIKRAESYKTHSGAVHIDVWQRKPVFRVMSGSRQYYVYLKDEKELAENETPFDTMSVSYKGLSKAFNVPVATGYIPQDFLTELGEFILFLQGNSLWCELIKQINVTPKREIELVSKIGSPVILLGKLDGYEAKLKKLQTVYEQGLRKIDWEQYSRIDLRYRDLIYGVKKDLQLDSLQLTVAE